LIERICAVNGRPLAEGAAALYLGSAGITSVTKKSRI
jgi:hypothetical protein